jgi:hypothetical protein
MLARLRCPPERVGDANVGPLREVERAQRAVDHGVEVGARRQAQRGRVTQRPCQRQLGVDDVVLRHVAEHAAERVEVRVHVDAVEQHAACVGRLHAGERFEQGRLAGAAAAGDADQLARLHDERDVVQHALAPLDDAPEVARNDLDAAAGAHSIASPVSRSKKWSRWVATASAAGCPSRAAVPRRTRATNGLP